MKITRKGGNAVTFKDVEQGDYFKYDGMSYIRCEGASNINAVCLSNGELTEFDDYDMVLKIVAEIVEG